ncbi:hypothetical protein E4U55_003339 [Claviceps digitariae]|nr:hypothetical protein E4U55_003339 [Claviceps digitariae]
MKAFTILSLAVGAAIAAPPAPAPVAAPPASNPNPAHGASGVSGPKDSHGKPIPHEVITIEDFVLEKSLVDKKTVYNHVSFKLTGDKAFKLECAADNLKVAPEGQMAGIYDCINADSKYRFSLWPGTSAYDIKVEVYHELGPAVGFQGNMDIPFVCHGKTEHGGEEPKHYQCTGKDVADSFTIQM